MPQGPFGGPQPIGVVYITTMDRPDAALALAQLYGFQGKRESRIGSVCVTGSGLQAAIYCDILNRFYQPGPVRNGNQLLPVGYAAVQPPPPEPSMVRIAIDGKYDRTIKRVSDTSVPEAVIRNGVIFNAEAVMILSAPATYLAKSLDLLGVKELYKERVKRLVIVDAGATRSDAAALRKVEAEFPAPIVWCRPDLGESLPFPGARVEKDFAWAPAHPVLDAYRAYKPMPYDAPSHDLAATFYAVHPKSEFFQLEGTTLKLVPDKKDALLEKFVEYAAAKPAQPQQRFRPPSNAATTAPPAQPPAAAPKPPEKK
jgi:hypothetical protein